MRIHHQDSDWVVPNIFGDQKARTTRSLDPAMLDKLDWWIKCLKDEGIYVWLGLHVGRQVKAADGIDGFAEISEGRATANLVGYNYVNSSIREAMKQFNQEYLNHRNRFTGLPYKDDPAIAALLITNENDLTNHYGNALLPDKGVPQTHGDLPAGSGEFRRQIRPFKVQSVALMGAWPCETIPQRS